MQVDPFACQVKNTTYAHTTVTLENQDSHVLRKISGMETCDFRKAVMSAKSFAYCQASLQEQGLSKDTEYVRYSRREQHRCSE